VRPGRHAAGDGSFGRSAGAAVFRGAALLAVAVIIGIVLLQATDEGDPFEDEPVVVGGERPRSTSAPSDTAASPATTVATRQPSQVKVIAANGTDTKGLAGRFTDLLKAAGYNVLAPTDTTKKPVATSAVYFSPGFETDARAVAAALKLPAGSVQALPATPPVSSVQGANVLVVLGSDVARTVTTTTVRSAATTSSATSTTAA
jgi:hypothetical protein